MYDFGSQHTSALLHAAFHPKCTQIELVLHASIFDCCDLIIMPGRTQHKSTNVVFMAYAPRCLSEVGWYCIGECKRIPRCSNIPQMRARTEVASVCDG